MTRIGLHANSRPPSHASTDRAGDVAGEQKRGVPRQHGHQEVHEVERRDDPEPAHERQSHEVLERGVVVKAEIRAAAQREDLVGEVRERWFSSSSCLNTHWFHTYTPVSPAGEPVRCVLSCGDERPGEDHRDGRVTEQCVKMAPSAVPIKHECRGETDPPGEGSVIDWTDEINTGQQR